MKRLGKGLYFITDSRLSKQGVLQDAQQVIEAGCAVVQYREKEKPTAELVEEAGQLGKLCREKRVLFLVNDRLDVALAVGADGVHLGQGDMPAAVARKLLGKKKIIGVTVHSVAEAVQAQADCADYVSVSPIFQTTTKQDAGRPVGVGLIKEIKQRVSLPIVAIGGINEHNLQQVLDAGADSIAVISAILSSADVKQAAKRIVQKISGFE